MDEIAVLIPCYNESKTIEKSGKGLSKGTAAGSNLRVRQQFTGRDR